MRKDPLITGQYYHIYNRGVDKRDIFMNKKDLERFILGVKKFNRIDPVGSISNDVKPKKAQIGVGHLSGLVSIVCYCFNPNHFHFIVKQEVDGGISEFFKRLLGGYTNYFNIIHKRSGALFQGKFKSHLIAEDVYFLKIRPYVNVNYAMHEIPKTKEYLIRASDKEYNSENFDIVSKIEAENLLEFYGNNKNFSKECKNVISMIRKERGKMSLFDEEELP
jgi:REP element-mobilizing transposase RayT